jgi:hypothetical protein
MCRAVAPTGHCQLLRGVRIPLEAVRLDQLDTMSDGRSPLRRSHRRESPGSLTMSRAPGVRQVPWNTLRQSLRQR